MSSKADAKIKCGEAFGALLPQKQCKSQLPWYSLVESDEPVSNEVHAHYSIQCNLIGGSWTYFQPKHTLTARGTRPRDKLHWFSHLQDLMSLIPVTSGLGISCVRKS